MDNRFNKAEWDFFVVALKEEARAVLHEVGSSADPHTLVGNILDDLQALAPREPSQEDRSEQEIWTQVKDRLLKAAYATRPHCIRCGTCCTQGSPTLAKEDIGLFTRDMLKPADVTTIRRGELAHNNATGGEIAPVEHEMIKVREDPGTRTCVFFQPEDKSCAIYDERPGQCRRQECWNPAPPFPGTEEPMTREDLLSTTGDLWSIICRHEERCSYANFDRIMARLAATKGQTVQDVLDMLAFDQHVRDFLGKQFRLYPETMNFFLGRPLAESVSVYGLRIEENQDGTFILTVADQSEEGN